MRIAYLARCETAGENGVLKKLVAQVEQWRVAGHEAALFILSRSADMWPWARDAVASIVTETGWPTRELRLRKLLGEIESWKPDLVYARFDTGSTPMAAMMRRIPTVLELNTDDITEYRLYLPRYQYLYHRLARGQALNRAVGFVAVTAEIRDRYQSFGHPTAVIANGIRLDEYQTLPADTSDELRLAFIGSPGATWHGVDKIIALASRIPDIGIDLVGPGLQGGMPANVTAHGVLGRKEYEALLSRCDAAIGTLAMHRNGMEEGSTLKVREYLAMGLPCIIGYRDTDFPEPVPFILQLPNIECNAVDGAEAIRIFCASWKGRRVSRESIAHIDIVRKEEQRLAFLAGMAR